MSTNLTPVYMRLAYWKYPTTANLLRWWISNSISTTLRTNKAEVIDVHRSAVSCINGQSCRFLHHKEHFRACVHSWGFLALGLNSRLFLANVYCCQVTTGNFCSIHEAALNCFCANHVPSFIKISPRRTQKTQRHAHVASQSSRVRAIPPSSSVYS